jgi:leucyl aminopeptidase
MNERKTYTFIEHNLMFFVDDDIRNKKHRHIYFCPIVTEHKYEDSLDHLYQKISKIATKNKLNLILDLEGVETYSNKIIEAFCKASYRYKDIKRLQNVQVYSKKITETQPHLKNILECSIVSNNILECMRLVDTPPNIIDSNTLLDHIKKNRHPDMKIKVLEEIELKDKNMNGILAINSGSKNPARLIEITYNKSSSGIRLNPVVLVGKGVIFDSGGLNLKRGDFRDMKCDKTGAVYVYGLIKTIAQMGLEGHFIALLPIVENMPSKDAVHPGDIIKTCNGKTVEISNTDAEGRIILADALCYAQKTFSNMKLIVDIATLTGQASSILGNMGTIVLHNKLGKSFSDKLYEIGNDNHELYWTLPLHRKFTKLLESDVADYISYNPNAHADTIMAGLFLNEFVNPKTPWMHLDIAGVAYKQHATGEPLSSLFYFLKDHITWA